MPPCSLDILDGQNLGQFLLLTILFGGVFNFDHPHVSMAKSSRNEYARMGHGPQQTRPNTEQDHQSFWLAGPPLLDKLTNP